jgi:alanyl-tRNA synthetase
MAILRIDTPQRLAKMRAHTATHLLHYALEQILWQTKQAWSLVEADYLRFDFAAKQPLTDEQINTIQTMINNRIIWAHDVTIQEMSLQEAKDLGAKAFFEDKYGDRVRVVSIHANEWSDPIRSIELCGWTHVPNTAHIWACIIDSQSAVASWIRRLSCSTWPWVVTSYQTLHQQLNQLAQSVWCQPTQLEEKLEKLLKEYQEATQHIERLHHVLISQAVQAIPSIQHDYVSYCIHSDTEPFVMIPQKQLVTIVKEHFHDQNVLIYSSQWWFALYAWKTHDAKAYCQKTSIKGWWSDTLIQGKDTTLLTQMNLQ